MNPRPWRFSGRDLAAERVRAGLRQADLAAAMTVSPQRVAQLEALRTVTRRAAARYYDAVDRASREERFG